MKKSGRDFSNSFILIAYLLYRVNSIENTMCIEDGTDTSSSSETEDDNNIWLVTHLLKYEVNNDYAEYISLITVRMSTV